MQGEQWVVGVFILLNLACLVDTPDLNSVHTNTHTHTLMLTCFCQQMD